MTVTDADLMKLADEWAKIKFLQSTNREDVTLGVDVEGTLEALVAMIEQFKEEPEDLKEVLAGFVLIMSTLGMKRVLQISGMGGQEATNLLLAALDEELSAP